MTGASTRTLHESARHRRRGLHRREPRNRARRPPRGWEVTALDNLQRRGSELNLPRLRAAGVAFRARRRPRRRTTCATLGPVDALVECSAEPSVWPGVDGAPRLRGPARTCSAPTHCLELAAAHGAQVVFLSTSRVYPIGALQRARADETRDALRARRRAAAARRLGRRHRRGLPARGRAHALRRDEARGRAAHRGVRRRFGLRAVVNRCGVIAGPWQMGKVDQGVFTYWMLAHLLRPAARLHRLRRQRQAGARPPPRRRPRRPRRRSSSPIPSAGPGRPSNVGGGRECQPSLLETTDALPRDHRQRGRDRRLAATTGPATSRVRLRLRAAPRLTAWRPRASAARDTQRHARVDPRATSASSARRWPSTRGELNGHSRSSPAPEG